MCPDFRQDIALSSTLLWFIFDIYLIPSLPPILESIEPLFHDSPAKSWSIYNEHYWPNHRFPTCFVYMLFICTVSLPFSFPRNMPLFREVLLFYGVCQGTAKSWRSPVLSRVREIIPLFIALSYSLRRSGVTISIAMAAGLALVPSILMAGKPPIGTNCR